jgi:23S rRNA (uracil1939-C5)-methyltransferase
MRLTIEKLVYGGAGLARTDEGVVFVPRTAPGDVIEAAVTERKKDYALARVVELLERSPDRREPWCPNYEAAGCCHWQHIRYERQLEIKEDIVRESLARLGHLKWFGPIQRISGPESSYRMRATFHTTPAGKLGFVREKSHDVVPVQECAALAPELNDFLRQNPGPFHTREVAAVSTSSIEVDGIRYRVEPETFFQANRFLLAPFASEVLLQTGPSPGNVLDLYCGSGFFTLQLARKASQVIGVESNPDAVRLAREHARLNEVRNVEFFKAEAETALQGKELKPQVIVLNPPRTGTGTENARRIVSLQPDRVVYVSCNPSTFAREASVLTAAGYSLQRLTMIDQFPNTFHIEVVGTFRRE